MSGVFSFDRPDRAVLGCGTVAADTFCTEIVFVTCRCRAIHFGGIGFGWCFLAYDLCCFFRGGVHDALSWFYVRSWMRRIGDMQCLTDLMFLSCFVATANGPTLSSRAGLARFQFR